MTTIIDIILIIDNSPSFEPVIVIHCLAALDLGAKVLSSHSIVSTSRTIRPCPPQWVDGLDTIDNYQQNLEIGNYDFYALFPACRYFGHTIRLTA